MLQNEVSLAKEHFLAMGKNYIAYYRVSTKKQGVSGLGLEAQKHMVNNFVGCNDCILEEFTDIESGKRDDRPELLRAIEQAKIQEAVLVIAKLDRLSRNAAFIFTLKDSGVEFVCADMPEANTLTIGIFATLAQHERELISERTRKALAAKKAKGWKPGTPENLTYNDRMKGVAVRQQNARMNKANRQASDIIQNKRSSGLSFRKIADHLNGLGYRTRYGKQYQAMTVQRLCNA